MVAGRRARAGRKFDWRVHRSSLPDHLVSGGQQRFDMPDLLGARSVLGSPLCSYAFEDTFSCFWRNQTNMTIPYTTLRLAN